MSDTSSNNKRIAKNTALLYARMLLTMVVSLYTSRVVLHILGVEDYGINNVVAGFVSILAFFTSSLSNVTQRYLSLGHGRCDLEETQIAFRQGFTLMSLFSVVVLILGETVGLWLVRERLVIPAARMYAALWIYQFALLSTVCAINQVTFVAAIVAREQMGIYAYLSVFEVVARLVIVFMLQWFTNTDHLILFGVLTSLVSLLTLLFHVIYCVRQFPEAICIFCWRKSLVREMGGFISSNLFGCFAWSAGVQGTNVILNLFFGPAINAARGIAVQVNAAVIRFTDSIMTAIKPQIIKSYAQNNKEYMFQLICMSSKYSMWLILVLSLPIWLNTSYILGLWLGNVPNYSVIFVQLLLIEQAIGVLINPLWIAANATGKIKHQQVYGRLFTLTALPISYLLLKTGWASSPTIVCWVLIVAQIGYFMFCAWDIHKQLGISYSMYIAEVIRPTIMVFLPVLVVNWALSNSIENSLSQLLITSSLSMSLSIMLAVLFGMNKSERSIIYSYLRNCFRT